MTNQGLTSPSHENRPNSYRIALIPGDGIGPEVIAAARRVLESLDLPIEFLSLEAGWGAFEKYGVALPEDTVAALGECDGALFGAVSSPSERVIGYTSPIVELRRRLDLYANLRPVFSAPVSRSRPGIDMLIVRENTEGLYVKRESMDETGERAVAERVITRKATSRIARQAFALAESRTQNRQGTRSPRVTIVHKANVLPVTDGLFREVCLEVAADYPGVEHEEQLVDSMAYRMIREPERYDVVVAPNLYGDILSDAAAALVGGLGLAASANRGDKFTLAEPVHGSAPDIAGQGIANPVAAILSAALLLRSLREYAVAASVEGAVQNTLERGIVTPDLGGEGSTATVTDAVIDALAEKCIV